MKKRRSIIILVTLLGTAMLCIFLWLRQKPVTITIGIFAGSYWDVPSGESYTIIDRAIERFEAENPGIRVTYRSGTLKEDYSEWLSQKLLMGDEPDVYVILSEDFVTFASIGVLKNLDTFIEKDEGFDRTAFYKTAMLAGQYGAGQYALPFETVPVLMFVNKSLLQKEDIPIPNNDWTWDDFYDICKRITRDTNEDGIPDQFGSYEFRWQDAVYTNRAELFNQQGTRAFFSSDEVFDAVSFAKKINLLNGNYRVTSQDYDDGKVAFRPFPFSAYRAYKPYPYRVKKYSGFEWDCIKLPAGSNGANASELYTLLYGISARTQHENAAWEFLKFLTCDKTTQLDIFRYSHGVSVNKAITESPEASQILQKDMGGDNNFINMQVLSEVIEQSVVPSKFPRYVGAMELADRELYQVMFGEKYVDTTLSLVQREVSSYLTQ